MLTIAYFTSRIEPHIEWFARSLSRDLASSPDKEINVILVDFHAEAEGRRESIWKTFTENLTQNISSFKHVEPMPCAIQGRFKKTKNEYFAAATARNTAFAYCKDDFIACVDDLSVMMPEWLTQVCHAKANGYVMLGAYKKVFKLDINPEFAISFEPNPSGVDSRWSRGSSTGIVPAEGSWFYGCSFALPLEWALRVNGFETRCDGVGLEDVEFGVRLERAGAKFQYNLNACTLESEEGHHTEGNIPFIRDGKMTADGLTADWWILKKCIEGTSKWTVGNDYNLRDLRSSVLAGNPFPMPTATHDWKDGTELSLI